MSAFHNQHGHLPPDWSPGLAQDRSPDPFAGLPGPAGHTHPAQAMVSVLWAPRVNGLARLADRDGSIRDP